MAVIRQQADLDFGGVSRIIRAVLNPVTTDPAGPVNGEIWYNSTEGVLKAHQGGVTVPWGSGPPGPPGPPGPDPDDADLHLHVASTGNDSNDGSEGSPVQTLERVIVLAADAAVPRTLVHVESSADAPIQIGGLSAAGTFSVDGSTIEFRPAEGFDVWHLSECAQHFGGWTNVSGDVWTKALGGASTGYATTIPVVWDASNTDVIAGRSFWKKLAQNTATPSAPAAGEFGWTRPDMWINLGPGVDPNDYDLRVPLLQRLLATNGATIVVRDCVVTAGNSYGLGANGGVMEVHDTQIGYAVGNGVDSLGASGGFRCFRVRAFNCGNDGFGCSGSTVNVLVDCEGSYNGDEGVSPHQNSRLDIVRGRYAHNKQSGMAAVDAAVINVLDVVLDGNHRDGPVSSQGNFTALNTVSGVVSGLVVINDPGPPLYLEPTTSVEITDWTDFDELAAAAGDRRVQTSTNPSASQYPNLVAGYQGNAIAADLYGTTILGGGTANQENVIGGDGTATVGTSTPNVPSLGTGANLSVITGGYDNVAGGLASIISGFHNMTGLDATHGTIGGGSLQRITNSDYATIGGGTDNQINGGTNSTIAGGRGIRITATNAFAVGVNHTIAASGGNALGSGHTIAGAHSIASGQIHTLVGAYSSAFGRGGYGRIPGQHVLSSQERSVAGDSQSSVIVVRRRTTDDTSSVLGPSGSNASHYVVEGQSIAVEALVIARDVDNGDSAMFRITCVIKREAGGPSALIGPATIEKLHSSAGAAAWDMAVVAGGSTGYWSIRALGEVGKTIDWVGRQTLVEVIS